MAKKKLCAFLVFAVVECPGHLYEVFHEKWGQPEVEIVHSTFFH